MWWLGRAPGYLRGLKTTEKELEAERGAPLWPVMSFALSRRQKGERSMQCVPRPTDGVQETPGPEPMGTLTSWVNLVKSLKDKCEWRMPPPGPPTQGLAIPHKWRGDIWKRICSLYIPNVIKMSHFTHLLKWQRKIMLQLLAMSSGTYVALKNQHTLVVCGICAYLVSVSRAFCVGR